MPNSNWLSRLALGFIAPAVIVIGYMVAVLVSGGDPLRCKETEQHPAKPTANPQQTTVPQPQSVEPQCGKPGTERDNNCQSWRQAEAAEEQACIARRQFWAGIVALVLLIATFAANAVAGWGAKEAAEVGKDTLVASQRAWIRRDRIYFSSPLVFREDGLVHSSVSFQFTNVGNAPALHIQKFAWLLPVTDGLVPEARASALFEKARRQPVSSGFALFPRQTYPRDGQTPVSQGLVLTKGEVDAATDDAGRMCLYLAAGINYAFASDPTNNHQTCCLFEVQSSGFIARDRGSIPATDLRLDESGFLGMDIAD